MFSLSFFLEEIVEDSNAEPEADVSTTKPSENQLSLSMCVNTDDVQDDLDEDLKEVDYVMFFFFACNLYFMTKNVLTRAVVYT